MKSKLGFIAVSSVIVLSIVIIFAVSIERKDAGPNKLRGKADSGLVKKGNSNMGEVPEQVIPIEPEPAETLQVSFAHVKDIAFWNDRIAAGTEGGVFTYEPEDSSYQFFYYANGLTEYDVNALLQVEDKLLVGTQGGLAQIDQAGNIKEIDFGFEPPVTALAESQGSLLIGTASDGLVAYQDGIGRRILEVLDINSVVSSGDQIWVSTAGHGLYSFDGMDWKKRFLVDDTTAFDYVADLGFKFERLYAGTAYGLYVFDGGRWNIYDEEDGLLFCDVRNIAFKGWKIVVGTSDWGIYEIFEDWVSPRAWSEGMEVTSLACKGDYTIVGTSNEGIYIAKAGEISHINPTPQTFTRPVVASVH
ncbi:MAG: hypothetical protein GWO41_11900 [candidate division Zixibacteria bacterium]|nr:hypothetical protein [candidate division Zixibacteria bacterium]NIR63299.1 hypothetical protein [candidate division Zixibacteria bacterium]NIS17034.1 hypothetical protein [candidate division Zixibacteria bacterium]NIS45285.1 hypothetical protein [candidate division Zixibacteria bacterium]NIT53412.1 hypothetical protein [candidate division Zixibacteria bacterium]